MRGTRYASASDATGRYELPVVVPASYDLDVTFVGGEPLTRRLVLRPGQTLRLGLTLRPAAQALGTVQVQGNPKQRPRATAPRPWPCSTCGSTTARPSG
ncbi:MAG: carboxypeptidase regulatory-like domain-containing protein [Hymenobacter sp.]